MGAPAICHQAPPSGPKPGFRLTLRAVRRTWIVLCLVAPTGCMTASKSSEPKQRSSTPIKAMRRASALTSGHQPLAEEAKGSPSNPWSSCYRGFSPRGQARRDLERLTRLCGALGGMRAITPIVAGSQTQSDPAARYTFHVARPGSCYRVFAVGGPGVSDLDLLVRGRDPEGVVADLTSDPFPVLPPQGPLCFPEAGIYQLELSVHSGQGQYAVQVWGTEPAKARALRD